MSITDTVKADLKAFLAAGEKDAEAIAAWFEKEFHMTPKTEEEKAAVPAPEKAADAGEGESAAGASASAGQDANTTSKTAGTAADTAGKSA